MKSIIVLVLFGFCLSPIEANEEIDCKCRLGLRDGRLLDESRLSRDSLQLSAKCDRKDYDICADGCNQTLSDATNGFDLDKPKKSNGTETELSLGQLYCNQIKADVSDAKILMAVTLECNVQKEIVVDRNGTAVSLGSTATHSAVTRVFDSGFQKSLRCVDSKYSTE